MLEIGRKHPISSIPFEVFHKGSWHAVDIVKIRKGKTYILFSSQGLVVEDEICVDNIRLRSIRASAHDCSHLLKVGVDVCVLSTRPIAEGSDEEPQPNVPLWYDAKIISKKAMRHQGRCSCLFSVIVFRERDLNGIGNNIMFERAEIVSIDRIAILQKLGDEPFEEGFNQWCYSEDCFISSKSKFVDGLVSSEVSWLAVLSIQKEVTFHMKSIQRNIVYQILNRNQESSGHDNNVSFSKDIKIVCFHRFKETLRPVVKLVDSSFTKETAETPLQLDNEFDSNRFITVDSDDDVEVLYDCMGLRRSKRRKVKPKRFTSYSSSTFGRTSRKLGHIVEILDQSPDEVSDSLEVEEPVLDNWELCVVQRSSDEEYEMSPTSARKKTFEWKVKEDQPQLLLTMGEDISDFEIHSNDSLDTLAQHSPEKMVPERRGRPRKYGKRIPSSHNGKPLYKKKFSYRKRLLLSAAECEQLIKQCMGNIQNEMDAEAELGSQSEKSFVDEKEDFNWFQSHEVQYEIDEHEDLWKELEHTLNALALLEQKV